MIGFLFSITLRGVLVASLGLAVLFLARRQSSAVRHQLSMIGLFSLLILPLLMTVLPPSYARLPLPSKVVDRIQWLEPTPLAELSREPLQTAAQPSSDVPASSLPGQVGTALLALYAIGILALTIRLVVRLSLLTKRIRRARVLTAESDTSILVDTKTNVPMTAWFRTHAILLPRNHESWSESLLQPVLLHEQAHIRRGDWFSFVFGQIVCILMWPNPLVWALYRNSRVLAEEATDDLVLKNGVPASQYAQALCEVANYLRPRQSIFGVEMAHRRSEVLRRVERILSPDPKRNAAGWSTFAAGATFLAVILIPVSSYGFTAADAPEAPFGKPTEPVLWQDAEHVGSKTNSWTCTLSDGRKAQILQVGVNTPTGPMVWRPDGTLIAKKDQMKMSFVKEPYVRSILISYPPKSKKSGITFAGGSQVSFSSGSGLSSFPSKNVVSKDLSVCHSTLFIADLFGNIDMLVPQIVLDDQPNVLVVDYPSNAGPLGEAGFLRDISMAFPVTSPYYVDKKDVPVRDKAWKYIPLANTTRFDFKRGLEDRDREVFVTAILKNGKKAQPICEQHLADGDHYYFREARSGIKSVRVESRNQVYGKFSDVKMHPNGVRLPKSLTKYPIG